MDAHSPTPGSRSSSRQPPGELERVCAFMDHMEERGATDVIAFAWGRAFFNSRFPNYWDRNFLRVEGEHADLEAEALIREAHRLHSRAGHRHRRIQFDSEGVARRLAPAFEARGWSVIRDVVMINRRDPEAASNPAIVVEVPFDRIAPGMTELFRRDTDSSEETVRQLVEAHRMSSATEGVRHFAVFVGNHLASFCELYSDGGTAQIEDVNTLEEWRNRGFARATVSRALVEARAAGCDLVFLVADATDWPRLMYARLGFEELDVLTAFEQRPPLEASRS